MKHWSLLLSTWMNMARRLECIRIIATVASACSVPFKRVASSVQEAVNLEKHLVDYAHSLNLDFDDQDREDVIPWLNDHVHSTKEQSVKFMMEAAEWEPTE